MFPLASHLDVHSSVLNPTRAAVLPATFKSFSCLFMKKNNVKESIQCVWGFMRDSKQILLALERAMLAVSHFIC